MKIGNWAHNSYIFCIHNFIDELKTQVATKNPRLDPEEQLDLKDKKNNIIRL